MKNKKRTMAILLSLMLFFTISAGAYFLGQSTEEGKSAFVKADVLFNEFKLKKELEAKYANAESKRKEIIDSLMLQLKRHRNQLALKGMDPASDPMFRKREEFVYNQERNFDTENQQLSNRYNQQIWARINQYVGAYGKKQGYQFIYGANGDGSLMYAADAYDITEEVVTYINEQYEGEK